MMIIRITEGLSCKFRTGFSNSQNGYNHKVLKLISEKQPFSENSFNNFHKIASRPWYLSVKCWSTKELGFSAFTARVFRDHPIWVLQLWSYPQKDKEMGTKAQKKEQKQNNNTREKQKKRWRRRSYRRMKRMWIGDSARNGGEHEGR